MASVRIRIDIQIIKRLKNEYGYQIEKDYGEIATESQIVTVALLELWSIKENKEIDIKFMKNGKIKYKVQ